jgi:hypothetical protein
MRAIIRVVDLLQRTPDIDSSNKYTEFFRIQVMGNPNAKDMYEKISAYYSKTIFGEQF